jgi:hypothetical protein
VVNVDVVPLGTVPGSSRESLRRFFESALAARRATRLLARAARVGLALDDGPAHFTMESGAPEVRDGPAEDADFTLTLPAAAVDRITGLGSADVGALGVAFFQLVRERDPAVKARIRIHASTARLVGHGYLGVLALGGAQVAWWLLRNGIRSPRAAIDRLRGR